MPSRILRDSYAVSDTIAELPPDVQDRFPRYLLAADDFGCFRLDPTVLKGHLWCKRADIAEPEICRDMTAYEAAGLVVAWEVGEKVFCFFRGWWDHQNRPRGGVKRKTPAPPVGLENSPTEVVQREFAPLASRCKKVQVSTATATATAIGIRSCNDSDLSTQKIVESPSAPDAPGKQKSATTEKPRDPRHAPLVGKLVALFVELRKAKYGFNGGADAKAVERLLALGTDEEILERWRTALTLKRYPGCASLTAFAKNWNEFAGTGPPSTADPKGHVGVLPPSKPEAFKNRGKDVPI